MYEITSMSDTKHPKERILILSQFLEAKGTFIECHNNNPIEVLLIAPKQTQGSYFVRRATCTIV